MKEQTRKVRRWIPGRWEDVDTKGPAVGETMLISRLMYPDGNEKDREPKVGEIFENHNGASMRVESSEFREGESVSQWIMTCKVVA